MRFCNYCKENKLIEDFPICLKTSNKSYRRKKCQQCYQSTKRKLIHKKSDWLQEYKKDKRCNRCGFADPRALCFHHLTNKFLEISVMISKYSIENVKKEIEKCEIICSNCHAIEHSEDRKQQRLV